MVVGLLGILKAGGAYMPLDPDYPKQRLAFMLEDAQVPVLLTQENSRKRCPTTRPKLSLLDADWAGTAQERLITQSQAPQPAYVIYTSGSQGRQRGDEHQAGYATFAVDAGCLPPTAADRVLQKPFQLDVSVWEFFAADYRCASCGCLTGRP